MRRVKGQAVTEFILVFLFVMLCFSLAFEVGRALITYMNVDTAASVGARKGIVTSRTQTIEVAKTAALDYAKKHVPFVKTNQTTCEAFAEASPIDVGYPLKVTVKCKISPTISNVFLPNWVSFDLQKSVTMVMEDV